MMPRLGAFACLLLCFACSNVSAQVPVRLLIVGDSWAEEQWLDGSHARVFGSSGLNLVVPNGALTTTSGSTAADWVQPANLQRLENALSQFPHIDTLQITLGGNDFLDTWNVNFTPEQFQTLINAILFDLGVITDYVFQRRPDIDIVFSLYDYPNFEDTRNGLIWTFACSPLWNSLGQPTPLQVNTAATEVIAAVDAFAAADPRLHHVAQLGQAQNALGLPGNPPGTLPPPGDLSRPSPASAMRERFLFGGLDCFHFNANAYDLLIANLVQGYLLGRYAEGLALELVDPQVVFNGQPRPAVIATDPPVEDLIVSYDGQTEPPVDAGVYALIATAPGWREPLLASYEILRAEQSIQFPQPAPVLSNVPAIELNVSTESGLPVALSVLSGPGELDGQTLLLSGEPGLIVVEAVQPGDSNWLPALAVQREIEVIEFTDELFQDRFEASIDP